MTDTDTDNPAGVPLGLGMALAQNADALARFAALDDAARRRAIERARAASSREEMAQIIDTLGE